MIGGAVRRDCDKLYGRRQRSPIDGPQDGPQRCPPALSRAIVLERRNGLSDRTKKLPKEIRSVAGLNSLNKKAPYKGLGADSEEKHEPASDINTAVLDSLKVLDPERPIREAEVAPTAIEVRL